MLCLFKSEMSAQNKIHNMAAALMQCPQDESNEDSKTVTPLAYVVSVEKIFDGSFDDNVAIKICSLQKNHH